MVRRMLASLTAAGVFLLAGCATAPVQRAGESVAMVATAAPVGVMQAQILGALTRTDAGCLAVSLEDRLYPLQFPHGSQLADDGEGIDVPTIGLLSLGDQIDGGGGYMRLRDVPEECAGYEEYAVWQTP